MTGKKIELGQDDILQLVKDVTEANVGIRNLNEKIDCIITANKDRDDRETAQDIEISSLKSFKNVVVTLGGVIVTLFCGSLSFLFHK